MLTAGTEPVELKAVRLNREAIAGCDLFLEPFDIAVFKLHDLSAIGADQVIMMSLVGNVVVLRLGSEVAGLRQSGLAKEIEGPIDRGQAKMRVFSGQLVVHLFRRDVFLFQEGIEDEFALTRELQLMFSQVLFQELHLFCMFGHNRWPALL
jgi:hypothetical protein